MVITVAMGTCPLLEQPEQECSKKRVLSLHTTPLCSVLAPFAFAFQGKSSVIRWFWNAIDLLTLEMKKNDGVPSVKPTFLLCRSLSL